MAIIHLGIGSNLGGRESNCRRAIDLLNANRVIVQVESSMLETEPWGIADQPKFINMCIRAITDHGPRELLKIIKNIESDMGRPRDERRWGPRVIDIDILLYDDLVMNEPDLIIPHPLMLERPFVLGPLNEIAADVIHPVIKKKIAELLQRR